MYGCNEGMKQAKIIPIKVIVQASSFKLSAEADIAFSSHVPSCSIFLTTSLTRKHLLAVRLMSDQQFGVINVTKFDWPDS